MEIERNVIREIKKLIIFTAIIFLCVWKYETVYEVIQWGIHLMMPFLLSGVITLVIGIPSDYIEKKLLKSKSRWLNKAARALSILIVILCLIVILGVLLLVLVPELGKTLIHFGEKIQTIMEDIDIKSGKFLQENDEIQVVLDELDIEWKKWFNMGIDWVRQGSGLIIESALDTVKNFIGSITTFFVAFALACYVLMKKETLLRQVRMLVYAFVPGGKADALLEVLKFSSQTFVGFVTGQCVEAVILGSMFAIVLLIFRIPYAILISSVISVTALVPVFGAFVGCAVGTVFIFIDNPSKVILFWIIFLVLQQIEGNLIYPKVVGQSVGLPSIWVLAAVTIGGRLMGVIGMLIFIPIASVSYALLREVVYLMLKKRKG